MICRNRVSIMQSTIMSVEWEDFSFDSSRSRVIWWNLSFQDGFPCLKMNQQGWIIWIRITQYKLRNLIKVEVTVTGEDHNFSRLVEIRPSGLVWNSRESLNSQLVWGKKIEVPQHAGKRCNNHWNLHHPTLPWKAYSQCNFQMRAIMMYLLCSLTVLINYDDLHQAKKKHLCPSEGSVSPV